MVREANDALEMQLKAFFEKWLITLVVTPQIVEAKLQRKTIMVGHYTPSIMNNSSSSNMAEIFSECMLGALQTHSLTHADI